MVEIWDARTGELVTALAGQTGQVQLRGLQPGRLAPRHLERRWHDSAVGSRSGEQQLTLYGHPAVFTQISFNPDGSQLASYGAEGVVRVWAFDLDRLIAIARGRLTRDFHHGVVPGASPYGALQRPVTCG
jgi:WD40 repeat protein